MYPDGHWDHNVQIYIDKVGTHPDRLNDMYFAFLFMLRAVARADAVLSSNALDTGNAEEDRKIRALLGQLASMSSALPGTRNFPAVGGDGDASPAGWSEGIMKKVDECRVGFDASSMFQVCGFGGSHLQ